MEEFENAVKNEDGSLYNTWVKLPDGKRFRCDCGCELFHKPDKNDLDLYCCNSCGTHYRGE